MINETMTTFGYPDTLIAETARWSVQLRPKQPTLGSLVLVCREPATAWGETSPEAFAELGPLVARIEQALKGFVTYERINYLMLMMVDPHVHFHVIPRHSQPRAFAGVTFTDAGWPGPPALSEAVDLDAATRAALVAAVSSEWAEA